MLKKEIVCIILNVQVLIMFTKLMLSVTRLRLMKIFGIEGMATELNLRFF